MSSESPESPAQASAPRQQPQPAEKRRLPRASELLLVLSSVVIVLLAAEIGLRLNVQLRNNGLLGALPSQGVEVPADGRAELGHIIRPAAQPGIVYELKPDLAVAYQGTEVHTDGAGFRIDPAAERGPQNSAGEGSSPATDGGPSDVFSLVGIGDSFMFGQGVEASETYLAVLRQRIESAHPGRDIRMINTAVPGYNTAMEVATLQAKGLAYSPDVVIIEFVGNDLSLPNFVLAPKRPWSLRRSFLGDFVRARLGARRDTSLWRRLLDAGLQGVPQDDPDGIGNATDPSRVPTELRDLVGWESFDASMRELQRMSETHHFDVVSISLDPADSPLERRALELSRRLGFHVDDVGAVLRDYLAANDIAEYLGSPLALSATDGHPSALAHRIVGEALAGFIEDQLLAASKTSEER